MLVAKCPARMATAEILPLVRPCAALWAAGGRCVAALARRDVPRLEVAHGGRLRHSDGRAYLLGGEALVDVEFD